MIVVPDGLRAHYSSLPLHHYYWYPWTSIKHGLGLGLEEGSNILVVCCVACITITIMVFIMVRGHWASVCKDLKCIVIVHGCLSYMILWVPGIGKCDAL